MMKKYVLLFLFVFEIVSNVNQFQAQCFPDGNALYFDSSNDYLVATDHAPYALSNMTVEAWVYITSAGYQYVGGRYFHGSGTAGGGYWLMIGNYSSTSRNVAFGVGYNDGNWSNATSTDQVPLNTWTHVAGTYDGSNIRVYINGVLKATQPYSGGTLYSSSSQFQVGKRTDDNKYFKGKLDELRVWSVARTEAQILANKDISLSSGTGLVSSFNFNQGNPGQANTGLTTAQNAISSSGNLTLTNFALTGTSSNWVSSAFSAGTLNGSAGLTSLANSNTLTLSGNTAAIAGWQSSTDAAFTSPIALSGTQSSKTFTNVTQNTYYRTYSVCNSSNYYSNVASLVFVPPVITSFSPTTQNVGSNITITGQNFNSTASANIVYFGGVKATVVSGTSTSLTVAVPVGALHAPITVVNNGFIAQSGNKFSPKNSTIGSVSTFDATSFSSTSVNVNMVSNSLQTDNTGQLFIAADLDLDGKLDIVKGGSDGSIKIARNTSIIGVPSFASVISISVGGSGATISEIETIDIDSDGDLDLILVNGESSNGLRILLNTSSVGNISFSSSSYNLNSFTRLKLADLNLDGKIDLLLSSKWSNSVKVYLNSTVAGQSISFSSTPITLSVTYISRLAVGDLNKDGKMDVLCGYQGLKAFINTSNGDGNYSYSEVTGMPGNGYEEGQEFFDIDQNGTMDYLLQGACNTAITLGLNDFSSGTFSISNISSFAVTGSLSGDCYGNIATGDFTGDGKIDIVNAGMSSWMAIRKNIFTTGSYSNSSFSGISIQALSNIQAMIIADIDGDNKMDLLVSPRSNANIQIFRNKIADKITITGTLSNFSSCGGVASTAQTVSVSAVGLTTPVVFGAMTGIEYSLNGTTYSNTLSVGSTGNLTATTVYIRMAASANASISGTISVTTTGDLKTIAVSGTPIIVTTVATANTNTICLGGSVTLSASGASTYSWSNSLGNGSSVSASPTTTTTYTVTGTDANGCTDNETVAITVNPLSVSGTISGSAGVCAGTSSTLTLSGYVGTISWLSSNDLNGTFSPVGNSNPSFTTSAINSTTYFKAQVTSGLCSSVLSEAFTVSNTPLGSISNITGPSTVTLGGTATYSIGTVTNATSYVWNLPSGTSLGSYGPTGSSVTINIDNNFAGGTISVQAQGCTNSVLKTRTLYPISTSPALSIVSSTPGAPLFCGNTTASLSTTTTSPTQSAVYEWTLPSGLSFANGTTFEDASIEVAFSSSFSPGTVSVKRISATETLIAYYNVSSLAAPATLTGPASLCGLSTATYEALAVTGADSYEWSLPSGMSGISTSTSISTTFGSGISGTVKVRAVQDGCGVSPWKSLSVGSLATPGSISGPTNVCGASTNTITTSGTASTIYGNNATYSIAAVSGATGYTWSVNGAGMIISSGQGSTEIVVTYTLGTFSSGTISVYATGGSGCTSTPRTLNVSKTTATISGPTIVCDLTTATYSINAPSGSNVTWTLPSWMTPATNYTVNSNPIVVNIGSGPSTQTLIATYTTSCGNMSASQNVGCGLFTQLSSASCGSTLPSVGWGISANNVVAATSYQFHITDPSGSTFTIISADRWITLSEATGMPLLYGEGYAIKVRVQLDGTYGAYGASCTVYTPSLPTTTLSTASCGATLPSIGWGISATNVAAATAYRFNITIPSQGATVYTVESPDRWITLSEAMSGGTSIPLLYGTTYSITVQVESGTGNWGSASGSCTVITPTLPTTTLSTASCGATLPSIGWGISATNVSSASAYMFEITSPNNATPYEVSSPDRWITLSEATGMSLLYGSNYSIRVKVQNGTGAWSNYGTSCSVSTPTLPTTTLSTASCGATLPSLSWGISATNVAAATAYRFNITIPTQGAMVYTVESPDRWITLSEATGMPLLYATTYAITVQAESGTGNWSLPSSSCTVTTPDIPTIGLASPTCGSVLPSLSWGIGATNVAAATQYEFQIIGQTGAQLNVEYYVLSPDRWITLSEGMTINNVPLVPQNNQEFVIRVRAYSGTAHGEYAEIGCLLYTPNPQGLIVQDQDPQLYTEQAEGLGSEVIESQSALIENQNQIQEQTITWTATATSNPFEHSFKVNLNGAEAIDAASNFTAQLTDMSGKVYTLQTLSKEALTKEYFGQDLAPGMYMLTLSQGTQVQVLRVVKR